MASLPHQTSFESQADQEEFQVLQMSNSSQQQAFLQKRVMEVSKLRTKDIACQVGQRNCQECLNKVQQNIDVPQKYFLEALLKNKTISQCSACHQNFQSLHNQVYKLFEQKSELQKSLNEKCNEVDVLASINQEQKKYIERQFKKNKELEQSLEQLKGSKQKQNQQRLTQIMNFYEQKLQSSLQEIELLRNQSNEIMSSLQKAGFQVTKQSEIPSLIAQLFCNKQNSANNTSTQQKIFSIFKMTGKQKLTAKKLSNDFCLNQIEKSLRNMTQQLISLKKDNNFVQAKVRKSEKVSDQKESFHNSSTMGNLIKRKNTKG